ncbi:SagB/ThcOx family dehydrogenase [Methylobacterium nodulans]|uniref:Nitroreductase n=1 Tax=Methylobacterium nodulans (strain LMG 21967 / CNCM I-2342 / ORS 2060) TaxID=460265 RepID=B8IEH1_METNO|nr:SagB family peptide dehydrogenase [Methylobacterium nodulans]ACL59543.1 nitroreductase [Methylobacterium nodulans ORS 2060]
MQASRTAHIQAASPATLSVRLSRHIALEAAAGGEILVRVEHQAVSLGTFDACVVEHMRALSAGLPVDLLAASRDSVDREVLRLVQRLARSGLVEYSLVRADRGGEVVIEPQVPDYWPQLPDLTDGDTLVLSRFAYMRRRASEMVLESPRSGALFRLGDPAAAAMLASLSEPQPVARLRRQDGFPGTELLALLLDSQILLRIEADGDAGLRATEGDEHLVLWDFHDFLFHTRSTEGRHANPLGGRYPYVGLSNPPPAIRPRWPGRAIDLRRDSDTPGATVRPVTALLRERRSTRSFDDRAPLTRAELARLLDSAARVQATWCSPLDGEHGGPMMSYTARPYPSAGASYELELYLAVRHCDGLAPGYYHYDAGRHALTLLHVRPQDLDALLAAAAFAMGAPGPPQVLITIAARFGRVSWKYSAVAYELILKNVGVLTQTLYLVATEMGLGGCAIGSANIELFARMTGLPHHIEGAVGQFALGRGLDEEEADGPA